MSRARIAVVGGSMGGLFAAVLLRRAGFDVTLYERSRHGLEGRGAGLVPQHEVFEILRMAGYEHLARIGVTATERVYLDRDGGVLQRLAAPQTQLSWDVLFRSFRRLIPDEAYHTAKELLEIVECDGAVALGFADGSHTRADLLIGADGLGSRVRARVAGPDARPSYVGYATWRGLIDEADVPPEAAILLERFAFYEMPGSHILGYLVPGADGSIEPGRRRYNWVWYRRAPVSTGALAQALTDRAGTTHAFSLPRGAMPDEARERLHRDATALLPDAFASVVRAEAEPFVQAIYDFETPRMARGRVALLGDAAFVARPHTAMGVAKAAGDAMALAAALAGTGDTSRIPTAYAAEREPVGRRIVAYGRRLGESLGGR